MTEIATGAQISENAAFAAGSAVAYNIDINAERCIGCGLCEAFCPVEVFVMEPVIAGSTLPNIGAEGTNGADGTSSKPDVRKQAPRAAMAERCWGCETCVGQCPQDAIRVHATGEATDPFAGRAKAVPLSADAVKLYQSWAATLKETLGLRWSPVAISLIEAGAPLPDVPVPSERLRYCQSLMAARRGRSFMMPANRHACPDGTSILGLTPMPAKLASGELYILFHKLDSIEAAKHMTLERPMLEPRSIDATVVTPLNDAKCEPQVIAVACQPEQCMWLLMSASYYTGHRHDLHASGYNAQCVETTLIPLRDKQINVSFGCYGCRASSDIGDDLMFVGIPVELMPTVVRGLKELGKRAIPQSRDKVYLPPLP